MDRNTSCLITFIASYHGVSLVVRAVLGGYFRIGAGIESIGVRGTANIVKNLRCAVRRFATHYYATCTNISKQNEYIAVPYSTIMGCGKRRS